jgi:dihydroflavonol-4-reductase
MTSTVFVTGAAGFIGSRIARILRERGDEVVAVVRDPARATALHDLDALVIKGDLGSDAELRDAMASSDAVIHCAGSYRVGIAASERPAMYEANVAVTERVLDAASALQIPRIVYVSTVNALGNTKGRAPDETFRRDPADGFVSYYDETKYRAHVAAETRIAAGAPIVIAMPGTVYGAADHSGFGAQLKSAYDGTARYVALGDLGVSPAYVDDLATGIVAALDRGRIGEAYIMCGVNMRLREAMGIAARAAGRRPPRISIPNGVLRFAARLGPRVGRAVAQSANLAEIVSASDGVTYWADHAKATAELGYASRDLATGARDAYGPR